MHGQPPCSNGSAATRAVGQQLGHMLRLSGVQEPRHARAARRGPAYLNPASTAHAARRSSDMIGGKLHPSGTGGCRRCGGSRCFARVYQGYPTPHPAVATVTSVPRTQSSPIRCGGFNSAAGGSSAGGYPAQLRKGRGGTCTVALVLLSAPPRPSSFRPWPEKGHEENQDPHLLVPSTTSCSLFGRCLELASAGLFLFSRLKRRPAAPAPPSRGPAAPSAAPLAAACTGHGLLPASRTEDVSCSARAPTYTRHHPFNMHAQLAENCAAHPAPHMRMLGRRCSDSVSSILASLDAPAALTELSTACRLRFRDGPPPGGSAPFCRWCSSSSSVRSACGGSIKD